MLGQWRTDSQKSAELKLVHTKNIVKTHLELGYDVVLPFLLQNTEHAEEYLTLASGVGADFYEFYLDIPKDEAVARLLKRGSWGESGLPALTDKDIPRIESLFESMSDAVLNRKNTICIRPQEGKIEETYQELVSYLD